MDDVTVLPAAWRDLRDVAALERACFREDAWPLLDVAWMLLSRQGVRLKAVVGGRTVGFIAADPERRNGSAWITTIGVHPDYQGRGIGARLLRACEAQIGAARIQLTVRASNRPARRLYDKFGYQQVAVWRRYYHGGEDGIVMEKVRGK